MAEIRCSMMMDCKCNMIVASAASHRNSVQFCVIYRFRAPFANWRWFSPACHAVNLSIHCQCSLFRLCGVCETAARPYISIQPAYKGRRPPLFGIVSVSAFAILITSNYAGWMLRRAFVPNTSKISYISLSLLACVYYQRTI
jgi:hypothetical protein